MQTKLVKYNVVCIYIDSLEIALCYFESNWNMSAEVRLRLDASLHKKREQEQKPSTTATVAVRLVSGPPLPLLH